MASRRSLLLSSCAVFTFLIYCAVRVRMASHASGNYQVFLDYLTSKDMHQRLTLKQETLLKMPMVILADADVTNVSVEIRTRVHEVTEGACVTGMQFVRHVPTVWLGPERWTTLHVTLYCYYDHTKGRPNP